LDINEGLTDDGVPVIQYACNSGANQMFTLKSLGNMNYAIVSNASGKCVDVNGALTTNGTPVIQWTCTAGSPNQTWKYIDNNDGFSFKLRDMNSQKCLTAPVYDPSFTISQQLYISTCSSTNPNQNFQF